MLMLLRLTILWEGNYQSEQMVKVDTSSLLYREKQQFKITLSKNLSFVLLNKKLHVILMEVIMKSRKLLFRFYQMEQLG